MGGHRGSTRSSRSPTPGYRATAPIAAPISKAGRCAAGLRSGQRRRCVSRAAARVWGSMRPEWVHGAFPSGVRMAQAPPGSPRRPSERGPAAAHVLVHMCGDAELPREFFNFGDDPRTGPIQRALPEEHEHSQTGVVPPARFQSAPDEFGRFLRPRLVNVNQQGVGRALRSFRRHQRHVLQLGERHILRQLGHVAQKEPPALPG